MKKRTLVFILAVFTVLSAAADQDSLARAAEKSGKIIGKITFVDARGKRVTINRGSRDGVKEKMIFDVWQPARYIRAPLSKKNILVNSKKMGQVVITSVHENNSRGEFLGRPRTRLKDLTVSRVRDALTPEVNVPPTIRNPQFFPSDVVSAGTSVRVTVEVHDVDDKFHLYYWEASGGALSARVTTSPEVRWQAPMTTNTYTVKVRAVDPAGGESRTHEFSMTVSEPAEGKYKYAVTDLFGRNSGRFAKVSDMAFDHSGNIYILDEENRMLVQLDEGFRVKMHTARAPSHFSFNRIAVKGDKVFFVDSVGQKVYRYPVRKNMFKKPAEVVFGGYGRTNGYFTSVSDIEVTSSGEVLILDSQNPSIHVYSTDGVFYSSISKQGKRKGEMSKPVAMATDKSGGIYVLDGELGKVLVFKGLRFSHEFKVGAADAELVDIGVCEMSSRVLVLDAKSKSLFCYTLDGMRRDSICGMGAGSSDPGRLKSPQRFFCDCTGSVYVSEELGKVIARYDTRGNYHGRWGGTDFTGVTRIAAGPSGELYLLDPGNFKVHKLNPGGWHVASFGSYGSRDRQFQYPVAISCDNSGDVFVLDRSARVLKKFSPRGVFMKKIPIGGAGRFSDPVDVSACGDQVVVLDNRDTRCVRKLKSSGEKLDDLPRSNKKLYYVRCAAIDGKGNVYVFTGEPGLHHFDPNGVKTKMKKAVRNITGMTADARGHIFLADSGRGVVLEVVPGAGKRTAVIRNSKFFPTPADVAVDDLGNLYVLDRGTGRIVKLQRE